jgi:hypothetical protein
MEMERNNRLDQIVQRLQNMEPFWIYTIDQTNPDAPPMEWYQVAGDIVNSLVIANATIDEQVRTVAGSIIHWGRMLAQCKRVWDIEARHYAVWKARKRLELTNPVDKPEGWKKPTGATVEDMYRTDPEYGVINARVERAEEAYNAALLIVDGFRALKDELRSWARRVNEEMHLSTP